MLKRKRRFRSLATELVRKSREAMLTAVQIFNNPQVEFKSELFIVTTIIAWTYLLHAHYRTRGMEYRRFQAGVKRRRFTANTIWSNLSMEFRGMLGLFAMPTGRHRKEEPTLFHWNSS